MQCPAGHRVPGGSRFCPECGLSLVADACPECGATLSPGDRFCAQCGAEVEGATGATPRRRKEDREPPAEDELRQITAVFCDIVSSTELSSRLDPEDFSELVLAYQERVGEVLDRYGGAVNKFLGDGILIQFGWPAAHDDDAERAILAALAIAEEIDGSDPDLPISVRVGIHTGPVLVGEMGSRDRRETMALGETMNRAARLQSCAPPGGVAITSDTQRLVRGIFVVEELGPQQLDGIPEPVDAFQVLQRSGVRSRLDAAGDRLTPFVSREHEVERLVEHWRAAASGEGRAVLISGEPGIGKSRLVFELHESLGGSAALLARGPRILVHGEHRLRAGGLADRAGTRSGSRGDGRDPPREAAIRPGARRHHRPGGDRDPRRPALDRKRGGAGARDEPGAGSPPDDRGARRLDPRPQRAPAIGVACRGPALV